MFNFLKKLWRDRRGNALAIACACMPLVVGAAGLATDTIQWTLWKRQLQRAADSAALAGVYDRENASGATTNTAAAVCRDLAVNLHTWMPLLDSTPCTGTVGSYSSLTYPADTAVESNQVALTLRVQQRLPFSSLFMSAAPIITASATAAGISTGHPCALALNGSGTAMNYNGNATVNAPTCILYSDSASANSASAGGSSSVTAKAVAGVGGISQSNNFNVSQYLPYSPTIPDPFANITPDTTQMHCAGHYVTTKVKGVPTTTWVYDSLSESTDMANSTYLDSSGNVQTGANCWNSLSTSASNKTGMTVPNSYSGPIYIDANAAHGGNGSADMQGSFSCSSCTIVLTNSDPTSNTIGTYSANAQSQTNITSPTTGTYAGIAVFQDRRKTSVSTDTINGGSNNVLTGAVYFPHDTLQINGTGTATSLCAMWVANNISFLGNSSIAISSPDDTACSGKEPGGGSVHIVRLVA